MILTDLVLASSVSDTLSQPISKRAALLGPNGKHPFCEFSTYCGTHYRKPGFEQHGPEPHPFQQYQGHLRDLHAGP